MAAADWGIRIGPFASSTFTGEINQWDTVGYSCKLDAPCTIDVAMSGYSEQAELVEELTTDIHLYRDGEKMFRGRCVTSGDTIGEADHNVSFGFVDYRGLLARRFTYGGDVLVFDNVEQAVIAWTLIAASQARSGGALGITQGISPTGRLRDRTYDVGACVGDLITDLGRVANGFEWNVDQDRAFNVWSPRRGVDNGVVLDLGGAVVGLTRGRRTERFDNAVQATGVSGLPPFAAATAGIATDPRGRWERVYSYPSVSESQTLIDKTSFLLTNNASTDTAYTVTLRDQFWEGFEHIDVGDTVTLNVESGRLRETVTDLRVFEVKINLTPESEVVSLSLIIGGP